jgi:hypothetical protein
MASFLGANSRHLGPKVVDGFDFVILLTPVWGLQATPRSNGECWKRDGRVART